MASAGHALAWKRDPRSALGWIAVCFLLPLLGPLLYLVFGVNRVRRTALQWRAAGRRLTGTGAFGGSSAVALPPDAVAEPLAPLRRVVDRISHRALLGGNLIVPLHCGEQAYPAMLEAIAAARHSVHLATFIFDGDETGLRFAEALSAAAARGVDVRLLIDGLGARYARPSARRLLRRTVARIGRFLPLHRHASINLRNHRKILVTDGQHAFTGGMNIGDRHLAARDSASGPVVDVHFRVDGPSSPTSSASSSRTGSSPPASSTTTRGASRPSWRPGPARRGSSTPAPTRSSASSTGSCWGRSPAPAGRCRS